ncbi:MAG: flavin reductase, partial [Bacteroidales bacterium]
MNKLVVYRIICFVLIAGVAVLLAVLETQIRKNHRLDEKLSAARGATEAGGEVGVIASAKAEDGAMAVPKRDQELRRIDPKEIDGNFIKKVDEEWMLITAVREDAKGSRTSEDAGVLKDAKGSRTSEDAGVLKGAKGKDSYNTMTASWGSIGNLWNKPVATVYVYPTRYTYGFIEKSDYYTLCFFDEQYRKALEYCGSHSGRDAKDRNKAIEAGLTPEYTELGNVYFKEAYLVLECKVIYEDPFRESGFRGGVVDFYKDKKDFHRM